MSAATSALASPEPFLDPWECILRLAISAAFGGILGFERELKEKPAGLRTHMMVALGATCFTLAAFALVDQAGATLDPDAALQIDPMRIVEGVVGGIGFLGAGAILRTRGSVEGLTTAGSIWLTGAVGVAVGAGSLWLGIGAVVLAVVILAVLGRMEHRWIDRGGRPKEP